MTPETRAAVHQAKVVAVSEALPPAWPKVKVSIPEVCCIDTKVEPAVSASVRTTPWAALGPLLVRVTVAGAEDEPRPQIKEPSAGLKPILPPITGSNPAPA